MTTPQPHSADEELYDILRVILQNTPGEFQIYTVMALEAIKRMKPYIEADRKKHELQAKINLLNELSDAGEIHHSVYDYRIEELENL